MVGCSANECKNTAEQGFKLFRIPKDSARQLIWLERLQVKKWKANPPQNFNNCYICEVIFINFRFSVEVLLLFILT